LPEFDSGSLLHWAVRARSKDSVELLLTNKASLNAVNKAGQTPLDVAQDFARRPGTERETFTGIAALLLKHGADENYTRRSFITVARKDGKDRDFSSRVFAKGTNDWNRYTLLELIATAFADPNNEPAKSLAFPDLSRVSIQRLGAKGEPARQFNIDVATVLNSGDCTNAPWLEWGDVVSIPEQDHPVNEQWLGLPGTVREALTKCLKREVEVTIKGQSQKLMLEPSFQNTSAVPGAGALPARVLPRRGRGVAGAAETPLSAQNAFRLNEVLKGSGLLRVSSDLTRVRVTRADPITRKPVEWTVNLSPDQPYDSLTDLWLRDGDVIEVPEKQDGLPLPPGS
jgi:hypothetical protein